MKVKEESNSAPWLIEVRLVLYLYHRVSPKPLSFKEGIFQSQYVLRFIKA
jgi:hypothetical protein